MNVILFDADETLRPLARTDRRAVHILEVLRRRPGDSFDAGIIDGPLGRATLQEVLPEALRLEFDWGAEPAPLDPIELLIAVPRPQTARKVLQECAAMGVLALRFFQGRRGEPGYARSPLWSSGEWRRHLILGAEQAASTRLPACTLVRNLDDALADTPADTCRVALDNYEAPLSLADTPLAAPLVLALGPERGWSAEERQALRRAGFAFAHLGARVLRVETACVAGLALAKARLGLM